MLIVPTKKGQTFLIFPRPSPTYAGTQTFSPRRMRGSLFTFSQRTCAAHHCWETPADEGITPRAADFRDSRANCWAKPTYPGKHTLIQGFLWTEKQRSDTLLHYLNWVELVSFNWQPKHPKTIICFQKDLKQRNNTIIFSFNEYGLNIYCGPSRQAALRTQQWPSPNPCCNAAYALVEGTG